MHCDAPYSIHDGIALFLRLDTMDADNKKAADQTSEAYQQNYQKEQDAAAYNAKYRDRWSKRLSTWREFGLLDRMLSNQGRCKVLLDLPCGGGRLSLPMARHADLLLEATSRGTSQDASMTSPDATGVDDRVWFSHSPA
jgi:cyclopropane fatty-acyl-phospholipid synthase-like methyltransferase